jgi:hypothetical protein
MRARGPWLAALTIAALLVLAHAPIARAQLQEDRAVKAQDHFLAHEYKAALDLYSELYAETRHPTYLRNIGRCHQMMKEADKALTSFRAYLRRASSLTRQQRSEIDGFIREMEALKKEQEPAPPTKDIPAVEPPVALLPAHDPAQPPALVTSPPLPPSRPVHERWWFWAATGAALTAGVAAVFILAKPGSRSVATDLGTKPIPLR